MQRQLRGSGASFQPRPRPRVFEGCLPSSCAHHRREATRSRGETVSDNIVAVLKEAGMTADVVSVQVYHDIGPGLLYKL